MPTHHRIVSVEGPCCAGKTTLSRGLLSELTALKVAHVRCYADHVGGGRFLPRPEPTSVAEDAAGLATLVEIERERTAAALSGQWDLILADRGLHTLLAHRYAIEQITGLACFHPAQRFLDESPLPSWPHLVLYLDVPQTTVLDRNRGKFPTDSIFIQDAYNRSIREFFRQLAAGSTPTVVWLDATRDPTELIELAKAQVNDLIDGRDGGREHS
jgi:thymidylate kinase